MHQRWALILAGWAFLLSGHSSLQAASIEINEQATHLELANGSALLTLAVINDTGAERRASVEIKFLTPKDEVKAFARSTATISVGATSISIPVPFSLSATKLSESRELPFYRIDYRLTPEDRGLLPSVGKVALGAIAPGVFALQMAGAELYGGGLHYRALVRAINPVISQAVAGAHVGGDLTFISQPNAPLHAEATTDAQGYATLIFSSPVDIQDEKASLHLEAAKGDFRLTLDDDVNIERSVDMVVSTDKPLYQPGQVLHARAVIFVTSRDPARHSSRIALANTRVTLAVDDEEQTTVYQTKLQTSRFGVVHADWAIPDNQRLGDYMVTVSVDGTDSTESLRGTAVRISRYELPQFTVEVKPDRTYYLPGQDAELEVSAHYLFGKPVPLGSVRVLREVRREWNYREQKWDIESGPHYEGEANSEGVLRVHVPLHREFKEYLNEYTQYYDLSYAAYYTDPSTRRTEQRRFDLRLTEDAIHVYAYRVGRRLPLVLYVSANYADGSPAVCKITVRKAKPQNGEGRRHAASGPVLATASTNRYGLAKITEISGVDPRHDFTLTFEANDGPGRSGMDTHYFWGEEREEHGIPEIRVETNKVLFREGEPIGVQVKSDQAELSLVVDAIQQGRVLYSHELLLHNGTGALEISPDRRFHDEVTVVAYPLGHSLRLQRYETEQMLGARAVLFPHGKDFAMVASTGRDVYKPGEEASAVFTLQAAAENPVAADLGVVVFDKAVTERTRTDFDLSSRFGGFASDLEDEDSIAGFRLRDLSHWDWTKPLPEGLDLLAEVLLDRRGSMYTPAIITVNPYDADLREKFAAVLDAQLGPAKSALDSAYTKTQTYPRSEKQLAEMLRAAGIHFADLCDPWGAPYATRFSTEATADVMEIVSAGPDKKPGTGDDFTALSLKRPYFRPWGEAIDRAARSYHARTGGYIHDHSTLVRELARQGLDLPKLHDPWGRVYNIEFEVRGPFYVIRVRTYGPQGKSIIGDLGSQLWVSLMDYFAEARSRIDAALERYTNVAANFPRDEATFREALRRAGIDWDSLRDPWGHAYFVTFATESEYTDRRSVNSRAEPSGAASQKTTAAPVTEQVATIIIRSHGEKKKPESEITVAEFRHALSAQSGRELASQAVQGTTLMAGRGAIRGMVEDQSGAAIPGATVVATRVLGGDTFTAKTAGDGSFLLRNIPPGAHTLRVTMPGFRELELSDVWVSAGDETDVAATLAVGTLMQMVMVSATPAGVQTSSAEVQMRNAPAERKLPSPPPSHLTTPRLREYFPETLYWQPDLEVGPDGSATLRFKLADSITTWSLAAIASTEDGEVAFAEKEIRAFQPFFVEHDPPPVLTVGDQIHLPVTIRNFLDKSQSVEVQMKPEEWFKPLGGLEYTVQVASGDSGNVIFPFQALTPVEEAKQRVTAVSPEASDAIERKVMVRPDGEDASVTAAGIIRSTGRLRLKIPEATIPGTLRAELKIYPNLMSQVVEAIGSMQGVPVGCGEQIISAAYPSLLLLQHDPRTGQVDALQAARARRNLELAYSQLVSLQAEDGGMTYWGRGHADVALTAYALRFLYRASSYIGTDPDVLEKARTWLVKQQKADGRWAALDWDHTESSRCTALLTVLVARALAEAPPPPTKKDDTSAAESAAAAAKALVRAFAYLDGRCREIDEPYLIASHALAAMRAGHKESAGREVARLRTLAHQEASATYWSLETNTPFYGWGTAGRLETTALAVEALIRFGEVAPINQADLALIDRGLLFLIHGKDPIGLWYSTQATSNVLEALSLLGSSPALNPGAPAELENRANPVDAFQAEIRVNGKVASVVGAPAGGLWNPIAADISASLLLGENGVEILQKSGRPASAQVVIEYYLPWKRPATEGVATMAGGSSGLRLAVHYDSPQTAHGTEVKCSVEAERVGFRGYGMLLGEIGLAPGAEVDRASLDRAMEGSGWTLERYDVLPDRVLVYLWPTAGATKFTFSFRLRYGIEAQTTRSVLYDYYNPEARVVLPPIPFLVR